MLADRARQKDLGAYYTSSPAVEFLVRWAMARTNGVVMDPSCGDGRFLSRAAQLGARQVIGCDLDPDAVKVARRALAASGVVSDIHQGDFFALDPDRRPKVSAVVGNPPFIRFQRFVGESRRLALESALRLGVRLTALSSAWAPFVVHSIRFLRPGGALAMVVPAEIAQTNYGLLTLDALCRNFAGVHLIAFARNFFDNAQTDTYLLLAECAGGSCRSVDLHPLESIDELAAAEIPGLAATTLPVDASRRVPFALAFLTPDERRAWQETTSLPGVVQLADLGKITNGYVTGANDFFLVTRRDALQSGLPAQWLRPTVTNTASLRGLAFTSDDIGALEASGRPLHLLELPVHAPSEHRPQLRRLIEQGEARGINLRFKCRTRDPWWRVPGIHTPDVFLPYMIGRKPIASVNTARATYTNTIHGLSLLRAADAQAVAIGLHSTLSLLSMEIQGRTYGGGILKLEPSEIERVHVVCPDHTDAAAEIDRRLRSQDYEGAVALADDIVLRRRLGLSPRRIALLQAARNRLMTRRYSRQTRRSSQ